jgi:predicted dehydrogenase
LISLAAAVWLAGSSALGVGAGLAATSHTVAFIGLRHHAAWAQLERALAGEGGAVRLVAIAETEPELIEEARRRGATAVPFHADALRMLDEVKPDMVWGFVENNHHLEVMRACAPRGIHVLFQKPLAATYADALAIRDLARKHGVQVLVNYDFAFYPTTYAAKARVAAGDIGAVWRMHGRVGHGGPAVRPRDRIFLAWATDPVQNGGGALVDFGSYDAAWAMWFKGRPQAVSAHVQHLRAGRFPKVEDHAAMVLIYPDGIGLFEASWNFPRGMQDFELFGPGGSLSYSAVAGEVVLRKGQEPPSKVEAPPLPLERASPLAYFSDCLRAGRPVEGMASLDINVGVMEILDAAQRSAATGQVVPLSPPLPR